MVFIFRLKDSYINLLIDLSVFCLILIIPSFLIDFACDRLSSFEAITDDFSFSCGPFLRIFSCRNNKGLSLSRLFSPAKVRCMRVQAIYGFKSLEGNIICIKFVECFY